MKCRDIILMFLFKGVVGRFSILFEKQKEVLQIKKNKEVNIDNDKI